jgi:hypothetical protein
VADVLSSLGRYGYVAAPILGVCRANGLAHTRGPNPVSCRDDRRAGHMNLFVVTALTPGAALSADLFWYRMGSAHGTGTLSKLCRVCLEPDSCVRRAKNFLQKHGLRSLLVSKSGIIELPVRNGSRPWVALIFYIFPMVDILARIYLRIGLK